MAVVPLEKILIVVHKSIKDDFLARLQKEGIVHISEVRESTPRTSEVLSRLDDAVNKLSVYKKKNFLETFVKIKNPVKLDAFEKSALSYDYSTVVGKFESIRKEKEACETLVRNLTDDIALLEPWAPFNYEISSLKTFKEVEAIPCIIPSKEVEALLSAKIGDVAHAFEKINSLGPISYFIFFAKKTESHALRSRLIELECEIVDFKDLIGIPTDLLVMLRAKIASLSKRLEVLQQEEEDLFNEVSRLEISYDCIANDHKKEALGESLPQTDRTMTITGWAKKRNFKKLESLVKEFGLVALEKIAPEADEQPPVALENPKWQSPYEMLIRLYSMPNPKEYDPTLFIAIFFPLFFALCLTDAIYGIFLALFSLYLMKKVPGDKSLLWILFGGGILTIFTGSMVGSWAGNLFDLISVKFLVDFKNRLMLFDPLITPMPFFYLALGIGYIHVLLGMLIEIFDNLKNGLYATAIFENLTWFVLIVCIPAYLILAKTIVLEMLIFLAIVGILLFSSRTGKPKIFDQILWSVIVFLVWVKTTQFIMMKFFNFYYLIQIPNFIYYAMFGLLIIAMLRWHETKQILGRTIWGIYNLYGITSYLSFVLSYIRLMALGMVTGGIAMTVNLIAWMVIKIPVVGIIFALIILIVGHLFNTVINCLGGFIHTMRLHYIEFFGRFYAGTGKPFKPFGLETKFVEIEGK